MFVLVCTVFMLTACDDKKEVDINENLAAQATEDLIEEPEPTPVVQYDYTG